MTWVAGPDAFRGARFSLLTQHGKERLMAPLFSEHLGATLERAAGFDTDSLGTFTRDVSRRGSQLDAARAKAYKALELLRGDGGVGSEGSYGPDPLGWGSWGVELVVMVDSARSLEIVGRAQGPTRFEHQRVATHEQLEAFARTAGFPEHGLVLRPDHENDPRIRKGFVDWPALANAFEGALAESQTATVFAENDYRAHANPTRMRLIGAATVDLLERLQSRCPRCGVPGFGRVASVGGLPCRECRTPTDEPAFEQWACVTGDYTETRDVGRDLLAEPGGCGRCNP